VRIYHVGPVTDVWFGASDMRRRCFRYVCFEDLKTGDCLELLVYLDSGWEIVSEDCIVVDVF
jgi:hypothetical protein